jgi:hypothetical protein
MLPVGIDDLNRINNIQMLNRSDTLTPLRVGVDSGGTFNGICVQLNLPSNPLIRAKADGTIKTLSEKYIGFDVTPR